MTLICGIDEAGRGPIIGPMVMCGISIEEEEVPKLKKIKVKDSKLLTHKKRIELYEKINEIVKDFKIFIIYPEEIDSSVDSQISNLNKLEMIKTAQIINYLKPDKAIIDCPSPNIKKYTEEIKVYLKEKPELIIEHKADVNHPECSAASIIAKVIREEEVEKIKKQYNIDFGSGYMSDPKTQKFLEENFHKEELHKIFRKSWLPFKNHVNKQKNLSEFS
ncbi:MAG: ribonuclease HII [Candidatus Nanoarchaeia archaeon]|nr:ribonuclease HII [Candidatus Nanoarchaeia archaeon]